MDVAYLQTTKPGTKAATVLDTNGYQSRHCAGVAPQITVGMSEEWEVHWIIAGISGAWTRAWTWAWVEYRLWAWVSVVVTTRAMFETVCIVRKTLRQTRICAIIRCNAGHVDINYLRHVRSSVRFRNKSLGSAMFPQIIWARQWYSLIVRMYIPLLDKLSVYIAAIGIFKHMYCTFYSVLTYIETNLWLPQKLPSTHQECTKMIYNGGYAVQRQMERLLF